MDIEKMFIIIFQNSYLTFLSSDFIVEPKNKSTPGIFVQIFCCEDREISFLKSDFWREIFNEKTAKFPRTRFPGFLDPPVRSHLCYRKKQFTR
jgi:hypothetical protein